MVKEPTVYPKTSLPSVQNYIDAFLPYVEQNIPVICMCFTPSLSGSYNSACNAEEIIREDYPDATKYNFLVSDTDLSDLSKADSLPEGYGNIRIALTKEKNASEDSDSLKTGEIHTAANNAANYKTEIDRIRNITVRDYNFSVAVTASYEDATYTYTTEYSREEKYDVKFTHNGKVIVWDDTNSCWRVGNTSGEVYTPDTSQNIQYEFLKTTTSCVFKENVYTETAGGGTAGDD